MADIAFLLIIFFMVTTAYSLDQTPMELPQTREQEQAPKGAAVIAIARDGSINFSAGEGDTQPVGGMPGLVEAIRRTVSANTLHPFTIKADRQVRYRIIDQVLEEMRAAGARNITLLSVGEDR